MTSAANRPSSRRWVSVLLVPLGYDLGAKVGVSLSVMPDSIAILWPPNSVLLAALVLQGGRRFPLLAGLTVLAEIAADWSVFSVPEALVFGLANAFEAGLAYALLSWWRFEPRFQTLADLYKFVLAAPIIGATSAAALGSTAYSLLAPGAGPVATLFRTWWFGDALGLLVFTPVWLNLAQAAGGHRALLRRRPAADALVLLAGLAAALLFLVPRDRMPAHVVIAPIALLPFLIAVAARFELVVVASITALSGIALAYATTHGSSPFGAIPAHEGILRAQETILTTSLMALGLAALLSQLRAGQAEVQAANAQLAELNRTLESRVRARTAELDALNTRLARLAMTDALTGLYNRRAFFDLAQRAFEHARRHGTGLGLVMMDIDHFKDINDRHGHQAGDAVLTHVAAMMTSFARAGDILARYGGEEFVLLMPQAEAGGMMALSERLRETLAANPVQMAEAAVRVTASFGVALVRATDAGLEPVLTRADAALYAAKAAGRNCVRAAEGDCAAAPATGAQR